jgi:hypothetical protein
LGRTTCRSCARKWTPAWAAPIGDETELTFTHTILWNEASEKSHTWGWTGALDKLVRHLESAAATADLTSETPEQ